MSISPILKVFVADHCANCGESRRLARHVAHAYPEVRVVLVNMSEPTAVVPDVVFAAPTFMLDGRIISIGNPSPSELEGVLQQLGGRFSTGR